MDLAVSGHGGSRKKKSLKDCSLPLYFSLFCNENSYHVPSSGPKEEEKSLNTELRWSWILFNCQGFDCISEQTIKHQPVPKVWLATCTSHRVILILVAQLPDTTECFAYRSRYNNIIYYILVPSTHTQGKVK